MPRFFRRLDPALLARLRPLLRRCLAEDAPRGDVTTALAVPRGLVARAAIRAKSRAVLAGLPVAAAVFAAAGRRLVFRPRAAEGATVLPGRVVAEIEGPAAAILLAERTALNFLQRLSGVATLTARYVRAVKGEGAVILDTRKTTPLWRDLERYAVRLGGGLNHRRDLSAAILLKKNHLVAAGGLAAALARVLAGRRRAGRRLDLVVEIERLDQLPLVLRPGVDVILADNFPPAPLRRAAEILRAWRRARGAARPLLEASGRMIPRRAAAAARAGAERISVGALTHSATAADFSLRLAPAAPRGR